MGGEHVAANSQPSATPPPQPTDRPSLSHAWKRRAEEVKQRKSERKTTTTSEETHTFHTSFQQESSCDSGIPCWFKAFPALSSRLRSERADRTDNSHSLDSSLHLNKGDRRSLRQPFLLKGFLFLAPIADRLISV